MEQIQLFVNLRNIDNDNQEFHNTGDQSTDGGTSDSQLRETQFAVNQHIIAESIDSKRNNGSVESNVDCPHRSQSGHQNITDDEQDKGPHDNKQISFSLCDNFRGVCENVQNLFREKTADGDNGKADDDTQL